MEHHQEAMPKYIQTMPKQHAYYEAKEEILDITGLSKLRKVMEKYNLSYVAFDFKLNVTVKRLRSYNPAKESEKDVERIDKVYDKMQNKKHEE